MLKVYRNFISDAGAIALARLIARQPSPLEELHLSHNSIQMRGAEALFRSIGTAQSDCAGNGNARPKPFYLYPRPDPNRQEFLPVWIRLEYNHICDTYALLQKWEQELRVERAFDPQLKLACFADRYGFDKTVVLKKRKKGVTASQLSFKRGVSSEKVFATMARKCLHLCVFHVD